MIASARPSRLGDMSRAYMEGEISSRKTKSVGVGMGRSTRRTIRGKAKPSVMRIRLAANKVPRIHACAELEMREIDSKFSRLPKRIRMRRRCHTPKPQNNAATGTARKSQKYCGRANSITVQPIEWGLYSQPRHLPLMPPEGLPTLCQLELFRGGRSRLLELERGPRCRVSLKPMQGAVETASRSHFLLRREVLL